MRSRIADPTVGQYELPLRRTLRRVRKESPGIVDENLADRRLLHPGHAQLRHEDAGDGRIARTPISLQAVLVRKIRREQDVILVAGVEERHDHADLHEIARRGRTRNEVTDRIDPDEGTAFGKRLVRLCLWIVEDVAEVPDTQLLRIDAEGLVNVHLLQ